jgi:hypothetical protein
MQSSILSTQIPKSTLCKQDGGFSIRPEIRFDDEFALALDDAANVVAKYLAQRLVHDGGVRAAADDTPNCSLTLARH